MTMPTRKIFSEAAGSSFITGHALPIPWIVEKEILAPRIE